MRLDFRVLWIDDQPDAAREYHESLRLYALNEGFEAVAQYVRTLEEARALVSDHVFKDNIDLIFVDYDLGRGQGNEGTLSEIRHALPYKDIVFYSSLSAEKLREHAYQQGAEGVFCASRDILNDVANNIFDSLIKKVLDIDHSRGIVMGATSDIDAIVTECLHTVHANAPDEKKVAMATAVLERLSVRVEEFQAKLGELKSAPDFAALLELHEMFNASMRLRFLMEHLKEEGTDEHKTLRKQVGKYNNDVPPKRNKLGHVRLVADGSARSLKGRDQSVTLEELKELRRELLTYRSAFARVAELLGVSVA
ncbi:MAG TPA: response regulator [Hyphomonas sp.]|nr:response regulator [Hyphomonas sp.]